MSLKEALEMIQRRRPEAEPIPAFREILEDYEARCVKERENAANAKPSLAEKKKKKRAGPVGNPVAKDSSNGDKRRRVGPSPGPPKDSSREKNIVGPTMPPPPQSEPSSVSIGPSLPATATIGPSMPPAAAVKELEEKTFPANESSRSAAIGPSLPPPSY